MLFMTMGALLLVLSNQVMGSVPGWYSGSAATEMDPRLEAQPWARFNDPAYPYNRPGMFRLPPQYGPFGAGNRMQRHWSIQPQVTAGWPFHVIQSPRPFGDDQWWQRRGSLMPTHFAQPRMIVWPPTPSSHLDSLFASQVPLVPDPYMWPAWEDR